MFWYDSTYILVIIGAVICLIASYGVRSTFSKYSKYQSRLGMTGAQAAEMILRREGIYDVRIERIGGELSDHYNPRTKTLSLSDSVYDSTSVAAVGVAAHEVGHAIQHAKGYFPLILRNSIVPVANIGSTISWPLIFIGLFLNKNSGMFFINLGIICFSLAVLFQILTLPVEFNASKRAMGLLKQNNILDSNELTGTGKVLKAAALTYVAGAASSILQLLRLILLTNNRRRD